MESVFTVVVCIIQTYQSGVSRETELIGGLIGVFYGQ